jgi:hypothetical protein
MAFTSGVDFAFNVNASPWFPSEPINTAFTGVPSYSQTNPGVHWACWVPLNFYGQNPSSGQGFSTLPFTTYANVNVNEAITHAHNAGYSLSSINQSRADQCGKMGSWDDSPWTGPVHDGFAASHNTAKQFEVNGGDVQDYELSSTACGSTSSSQASTADSETSTAGNVPIDDLTTIPADLFADMLRAGQEARARGQHRYDRKTRTLQRKDISDAKAADAKAAVCSSTKIRRRCPSFPPPPPPIVSSRRAL